MFRMCVFIQVGFSISGASFFALRNLKKHYDNLKVQDLLFDFIPFHEI